MAIQKELWTGELIKGFRHEATFLSRIQRKDEYVKENAIHLVDLGADPEVLVNNTTYPIPTVTRTDEDVVLSLDKFDTKNTKISDDELHALPYDKPGSVIEQHREVLEEKSAEKAIHSLAPSVDSATTPLVLTTGASNGKTNARQRLTPADLISMKEKLDELKVPKKGRELVLCPSHVADLLMVDESFAKQYKNMKTGEILNLYGFIISEFPGNPNYADNLSTLTKKAFGAAADPATDQAASIVYYNKRAVQATGSAVMYHKEASTDPENRASIIGFRVYHICLPKKNTGFGAIVSDLVTP